MVLFRRIVPLVNMSCCNNSTNNFSNFVTEGKKIVGAGLNFYEALKVLNVPKPDKPIIFLKATSSYIQEGEDILIPPGYEVKEEIELGVIIGKRARNVTTCEAMNYVAGYCAALDLTAFNVANESRKQGHPWTMAKAFDTACPVSKFIPKEQICDPNNVQLFIKVNDKCREGNTSDLIFNIPTLISYCSKYMTLEPNDLILTGTPPGQMDIKGGDKIEAGIKDVVTINFTVQQLCC